MDRPSKTLPTPSFRTVSVGTCYTQTATDRFGNDAKGAIRDRERTALGMHPEGLESPFTWPNIDAEDGFHPDDSIYRLVPSMQGYRNNLTALSQAYNLYFVAYQGHIFVYVPRSIPKQTIPRHPDLQIYPQPSKEAVSIRGCVDPITPHTINHIITGYLGEEEILVACYDDGDVVAYYVKEIANSVSSKRDIPTTQRSSRKAYISRPLRLFFHENVGHTAWGLAIHRKSRLIAVSTNRFEVTVFAFALATCRKKSRDIREFCDCCQSCDSTESGIPRRARNWRIVVALGTLASNVPNVCFVDSEDGQAEKVCAIDIKGVIWMADIWKMFQPVARISPSAHHLLQSEEFWPASSRGWGVLALPEESFVPVKTLEEMLGLPEKALNIFQPGSGCPQPMVNVTECLAAIPDNPCPPPTLGARAGDANAANLTNDQSDESEAESEESEDQSDEANELDEEEGEDADLQESEEDQGVGDGEGEEGNEEVIVAQGIPEIIAADQGGSVVLFPPPPAGLQFQQALQDLDEALGQLAYAVQEFQEAISAPDTPEPILVPAQDSQDQDSVISTDERRSSFDPMFSGQHRHSQLNSPPVRLDMAFFPHSGKIQAIPRPTSQLLAFLRRPIEFNANTVPAVEDHVKDLTKRYHFIRTYEKDLELRSLRGENEMGLKEIGVLCPNAVTLGCFQDRSIRPYFRATSRLSLVVHVPELSLVVVGSPIGRVLLVTPTKLMSPVVSKAAGIWHHGLRVEWVLPRLSDEQTFRPVLRPLHGLAVGPVQDDHMNGNITSRATAPKRYRLMLHYRNHDILTYEVTREEQTGRLCIF
ncbi:CRT10 domain-containing protein [Trichoderma ceciliae]